jgi:hypothetical protein
MVIDVARNAERSAQRAQSCTLSALFMESLDATLSPR